MFQSKIEVGLLFESIDNREFHNFKRWINKNN